MEAIEDRNLRGIRPLPAPRALKARLPLSPPAAQTVGAARNVTVGATQAHEVGLNDTWVVGMNRTTDIGRNDNTSIGNNRGVDVGDDDSLKIGKNRTVDVGKELTINVGDQITLKKPLEKIGQITMKPIDFTGRQELLVNADATGGSIRIEILDEDGYRVRGFNAELAAPITSDSLDHRARWKGSKSIADLPAGKYQIRVHLEKAEVFALTLK